MSTSTTWRKQVSSPSQTSQTSQTSIFAGKVEIVLADVVLPNKGLKKLIRVNIPEGQGPLREGGRDDGVWCWEHTHTRTHTHTHTHACTHTHTHTHTHTAGYNPVAKKIRDQYRVLVSPKKIYLEPLNQLGLHEYMGVRSYNPCYMGRRVIHTLIHSFSYSCSSYLHTPILILLFFIPSCTHSHTPVLHTLIHIFPFPHSCSPD